MSLNLQRSRAKQERQAFLVKAQLAYQFPEFREGSEHRGPLRKILSFSSSYFWAWFHAGNLIQRTWESDDLDSCVVESMIEVMTIFRKAYGDLSQDHSDAMFNNEFEYILNCWVTASDRRKQCAFEFRFPGSIIQEPYHVADRVSRSVQHQLERYYPA